MHLFIIGLLLGWGAAIPIGPINLEIIRRNLRYGTPSALCLGFGACSADLTYLFLLSFGILTFLNYPPVLHILGIIGALILAWFGISAWRMHPQATMEKEHNKGLLRHYIDGYLLTLLNPFTVLFWISVSAQIMNLATHKQAIFLMGSGVLLGTISWICILNTGLQITRHRFSQKAIFLLNKIGSIILLGFAAYGLFGLLR